MTTNQSPPAQASDEPMRNKNKQLDDLLFRMHDAGSVRERIKAYNELAALLAPLATADVGREKLPHGHRDDYYLLANSRTLAMEPIRAIQNMQNWVLAKRIFATGSTSAYEICHKAGIDPEAYKVERATKGAKP